MIPRRLAMLAEVFDMHPFAASPAGVTCTAQRRHTGYEPAHWSQPLSPLQRQQGGYFTKPWCGVGLTRDPKMMLVPLQ